MKTTTSAARTTAAYRKYEVSTPRWRSFRWAGYAACVWSLVYMLPHLYWAMGGTAMLSAIKPSASDEPAFRLINWIASAMLTGAALIVFLLARGIDRRLLRWPFLAIVWTGAVLSIAHALYGIADRTLIVTGVNLVDARPFTASEDAWVLWDLLVFEPWFLIEGVLFGLAGWAALHHARDRRRWLWLSALGLLAALGTAVLGVRVA